MKIAIIGAHPDTRSLAPWDDSSWEFWGANEYAGPQFNGYIKHWDRWFQLHTEDIFRRANNWNDPNHEAWLQGVRDKPLYMLDHYEDIPASQPFPFKHIKDTFDLDERTEFFGCTVAHQLAFALYLGATTIGVWGVEAKLKSEYGGERDSLSFWFGMAKGMGVKLVFPDGCSLLGKNTPVYGRDGITGITVSELENRLKKSRNLGADHEVQQLLQGLKESGAKTVPSLIIEAREQLYQKQLDIFLDEAASAMGSSFAARILTLKEMIQEDVELRELANARR